MIEKKEVMDWVKFLENNPGWDEDGDDVSENMKQKSIDIITIDIDMDNDGGAISDREKKNSGNLDDQDKKYNFKKIYQEIPVIDLGDDDEDDDHGEEKTEEEIQCGGGDCGSKNSNATSGNINIDVNNGDGSSTDAQNTTVSNGETAAEAVQDEGVSASESQEPEIIERQDFPFHILSEKERYFKRFNMCGREVKIMLTPLNKGNPLLWFENAMEQLLEYFKCKSVQDADQMGMSIRNDGSPDKEIAISFRRSDQLKPEVISTVISKVVQSNDAFLTSAPLTISLHHIAMPVGRGGGRFTRPNMLSFSDFCRRKRSIICINNSDNLCLARSIVVAMSLHSDDDSTKKRVQRDSGLVQTSRAQALCAKYDVDLTNGGGVEEIKQFQRGLNGWKITVFTDRKGREVLFEGPDGVENKRIDLIYEDHHFNVIKSLTGVMPSPGSELDTLHPLPLPYLAG
ncbi:hypothetical protein J437_LFUL013073 [Ladona fulva]|uniref:Uncharacterized protein n=1 Tax=Ladona fulva TaxID=123851 RepID=A0A8K0P5J2_LADFU|nr:hypothetical protein J437_LFUL013073 [Ladona fulva]